MHISEALNLKEEAPPSRSQRNDLLKQIYELYYCEQEHIHNKKYRWKLYVLWLKEQGVPNTKENVQAFKKTKTFKNTRGFSAKTMASFFLSHVKTEDLFHVLSVVKDRHSRNEPVGVYIKSLVKG